MLLAQIERKIVLCYQWMGNFTCNLWKSEKNSDWLRFGLKEKFISLWNVSVFKKEIIIIFNTEHYFSFSLELRKLFFELASKPRNSLLFYFWLKGSFSFHFPDIKIDKRYCQNGRSGPWNSFGMAPNGSR